MSFFKICWLYLIILGILLISGFCDDTLIELENQLCVFSAYHKCNAFCFIG